MTEQRINAYEGLFLFPQAVSLDLQAPVDHLRAIMAKTGAQIISLRKWEERRLAYEIKGNKRGVYFLLYFRAPRTALIAIERSCNLSEQVLRAMMTRADHLTQEQMEAADGSAELADEIKLRAEHAAAAPELAQADAVQTSTDAEDNGDDEEPVTVETGIAPTDAAAR